MRAIEFHLTVAEKAKLLVKNFWLTDERMVQILPNVWQYESDDDFEEVMIDQLVRSGVSKDEFVIEDY